MATISELYEAGDDEASEYLDEIPRWIDQKVHLSQIAGVIEGGCESGAYMPAVRYYDAAQTMAEYGDDVFQYIEDTTGELPAPPDGIYNWSQLACHYLSYAVSMWMSSVADEIEIPDDDQEGEES